MEALAAAVAPAPTDVQRGAPVVKPYDFRRPRTLARDHARALELAFDTFARQWGTQLTAKVRVLSQVSCDQVQLLTYDEYAASLPPTTAMVLCPVEGRTAKAVVQFPTAAALGWVSHMLGASRPGALPDRIFTPVEQALVRRLVDDALDDLRYSFGQLLVDPISVGGFQYNSQFAQAAAKSDLMIVATFEIRVGDRLSSGTVALPAELVMPQLGGDDEGAAAVGARRMVTDQLAAVPVELAMRLEPTAVRPADVLGLAVGDLNRLPHPHHRPLEVAVDGLPVGRAALGQSGSRLAGVLVSTVHPREEGSA